MHHAVLRLAASTFGASVAPAGELVVVERIVVFVVLIGYVDLKMSVLKG
jgi:hypothetical protein